MVAPSRPSRRDHRGARPGPCLSATSPAARPAAARSGRQEHRASAPPPSRAHRRSVSLISIGYRRNFGRMAAASCPPDPTPGSDERTVGRRRSTIFGASLGHATPGRHPATPGTTPFFCGGGPGGRRAGPWHGAPPGHTARRVVGTGPEPLPPGHAGNRSARPANASVPGRRPAFPQRQRRPRRRGHGTVICRRDRGCQRSARISHFVQMSLIGSRRLAALRRVP